MAEHRLRSTRQDGRDLARAGNERVMAHDVDAAMEAVQLVAADARGDRALPYPGGEQLGARDDAVLALGQRGDDPVAPRPGWTQRGGVHNYAHPRPPAGGSPNRRMSAITAATPLGSAVRTVKATN